jgi:hypothetical protein
VDRIRIRKASITSPPPCCYSRRRPLDAALSSIISHTRNCCCTHIFLYSCPSGLKSFIIGVLWTFSRTHTQKGATPFDLDKKKVDDQRLCVCSCYHHRVVRGGGGEKIWLFDFFSGCCCCCWVEEKRAMRDDAPRCVMIAIGYTEEVEAGPETSISLNSEWKRRRRKQVELLLYISSRDPRKSSWKKTTTTHCWMCYRSPLRVLLLLYIPSTPPPMDIREKKRISRTFFL